MAYRARTCRPVRRRRRVAMPDGWTGVRNLPELSSAGLDKLLRALQWLSLTAAIFSLTAAAVEFFL